MAAGFFLDEDYEKGGSNPERITLKLIDDPQAMHEKISELIGESPLLLNELASLRSAGFLLSPYLLHPDSIKFVCEEGATEITIDAHGLIHLKYLGQGPSSAKICTSLEEALELAKLPLDENEYGVIGTQGEIVLSLEDEILSIAQVSNLPLCRADLLRLLTRIQEAAIIDEF